MADFNSHLKNNKILVFFTIFAFLYMSCFTSCSKPKNQEKIEIAQKSGRTEKSEAPKTETASNQETAESDNFSQSDKSDDPCAGCPPIVDASAENAGQKKPLTQEELNQKADKFDRYFQALEEAVKEIPRDTFDPQAIVDKVGKDPEALFRWVRDNTYLVPYQGVLRGPVGVLMDRVGNSLDRALLLHKLQGLAGFEVQLARGRLTEVQANNLITEYHRIPENGALPPSGFSLQELGSMIDRYAKTYDLDKEQLREVEGELSHKRKLANERIDKQVRQQTSDIYEKVKAFASAQDLNEHDAESTAFQDHWWVQIYSNGRWIDLDPSLSSASPESRLTEVNERHNPSDLTQDLLHLVDLKIVIEQWKDGRFSEETVLEHTLQPSELFNTTIKLSHQFMNLPKSLDIFAEQDPLKKIKDILANENEWMPILSVGSETVKNYSFTASGDIIKNPGRKKSGTPLGGFASALSGRGEEKEETKESILTAEWIEYGIRSPGFPVKKMRRNIFDIAKFSRLAGRRPERFEIKNLDRLDRALSLMSVTEILIQPSQWSSDFLAENVITKLLLNREAINEILIQNKDNKEHVLDGKLNKAVPLPGLENDLALVRFQLSPNRSRFYISTPNILTYSKGLRRNSQDNILLNHSLDIVANEVAVLPRSNDDAFQIRLEQGIIDTNAEAFLLSDVRAEVENTAEVFSKSKLFGLEWRLIGSSTDPTLPEVKLSEDARYQIYHDLADGYLVFVPNKTALINGRVFSGWWRIDPKTGVTVGVSESGHGQALLEYVGMGITAMGALICIFGTAWQEPIERSTNSWKCALNWAGTSGGYVVGMIFGPINLPIIIVYLAGMLISTLTSI